MQLDRGYKGFSFSKEGPLDMRMDPTSPLTAEEIVNKWPEKELGTLFREYGEEPFWRSAAKAIVDARRKRQIKTTTELSDVIVSAVRRKGKKKLHPSTLIFQALRICVNRELESIQAAITKAINLLAPGGRIGVISFHRLEDRIVKNVFKTASSHPSRRQMGVKSPVAPLLKLLTKKPLTPSFTEVKANPRSRSAKMRFAERV